MPTAAGWTGDEFWRRSGARGAEGIIDCAGYGHGANQTFERCNMNADTARDLQNFRQVVPKRHTEARDTDIVLSSEILTESRVGKEAIWDLL
jgi:hypothetical protein